ncbi:hypothetical protein K1719_024242 [Acacia pycnantha]|nr:hypothetical protein K1719_024242 [Acacia pycnantha]
MATSLDESTSLQLEGDSDEDEDASEDLKEKILEQPVTSEQIAGLLADTERARITKKLSEANQHNRFLKRQLQIKEESLVNFKSELAVLELQVQALVKLAEEIAQSAIPEGARKINGKYIQSHLVSRLEAMHEKLKEQIKDVDSVQSKEVPVFWVGMAESVQVMGSFDGWSQGEYLSPEYDGSYTRFSSTLMLRPGRYEIKFLVDGEWKLSPEFPTVGEGLTKNNLRVTAAVESNACRLKLWCCLDSQPQAILFSRNSRTLGWENTHRISYNITAQSSRLVYRGLASSYPIFNAVHPNRPFFDRAHSMATSLDESTSLQLEGDSDEDEDASEDLKEKILEQPVTSEQIAGLLADTERARITKKLSEANQHNRFLKRQLQIKEESLVNFKSELAVLELQVQALVKLAEEIAQSAIPEGARKINGKYIQSHLVSRLEAMHEKLKEQIKDVDSVQSKEVPVFWVGMAESVQVMGSFDGWSQGEYLSPEYDGSYTRFSSTLMLRPGRYEIKFLVDGEWKLSPEFPTVAAK